MNRRKFFEDAGRWLSAAALGLLGGYLALERMDGRPAACTENPFCGQCRKAGSCGKPQAIEYRSGSGKTEKNRSDGKR